jgi:hypothetical protein
MDSANAGLGVPRGDRDSAIAVLRSLHSAVNSFRITNAERIATEREST